MKEEIIKKELLAIASEKDGKLFVACSAAFEIADKLSVARIEVGKVCNKEGIKIMNCQLGCF
jgi:hypothetical protein